MTCELTLYRAVQAARELLAEGRPLDRAATVAAEEFRVRPADVARLADEAHQAVRAARRARDEARRAPRDTAAC